VRLPGRLNRMPRPSRGRPARRARLNVAAARPVKAGATSASLQDLPPDEFNQGVERKSCPCDIVRRPCRVRATPACRREPGADQSSSRHRRMPGAFCHLRPLEACRPNGARRTTGLSCPRLRHACCPTLLRTYRPWTLIPRRGGLPPPYAEQQLVVYRRHRKSLSTKIAQQCRRQARCSVEPFPRRPASFPSHLRTRPAGNRGRSRTGTRITPQTAGPRTLGHAWNARLLARRRIVIHSTEGPRKTIVHVFDDD